MTAADEQAILEVLEMFTVNDLQGGVVGLMPHIIQCQTGLDSDPFRAAMSSLERTGQIRREVRGAVGMFVRVRS